MRTRPGLIHGLRALVRRVGRLGLGLGLVGVTACGGPRWHAVSIAPGAVYRYDAPIERYAPGDPGLWIVTARDATPAGRTRLARLLDDPDDVVGDGFVVWLPGERATWLAAHPEVAAVVPLQPAQRLGTLPAGAGVDVAIGVRIDLADGAVDVQRDAVLGWLADHGAKPVAIGPHTLDATLAPALARELATLGPVRWIERRD